MFQIEFDIETNDHVQMSKKRGERGRQFSIDAINDSLHKRNLFECISDPIAFVVFWKTNDSPCNADFKEYLISRSNAKIQWIRLFDQDSFIQCVHLQCPLNSVHHRMRRKQFVQLEMAAPSVKSVFCSFSILLYPVRMPVEMEFYLNSISVFTHIPFSPPTTSFMFRSKSKKDKMTSTKFRWI